MCRDLKQDAEHQGARGHREPHRLHRHGPEARRAAVLERQGQEPVQGQARAAGAVPGDRHRRDQDQRPCADCRSPSGRACLPSPLQIDRRAREAACLRSRQGRKQLLAEAGYGERLRGDARLPQQPLCQRREDLPGAGRDVGADRRSRSAVNAMPRANYFPKLEKTDTSMYMLGWGGGIDRRHLHPAAGAVDATTARATATTTTAATPNPKLDELVAKIKVDMSPRASGSRKSATRWRRTTPRSTIFRCTGR